MLISITNLCVSHGNCLIKNYIVVEVKVHGEIFQYKLLEEINYICSKFQPDITNNIEVIVNSNSTALSVYPFTLLYSRESAISLLI